MRGLARLQDWRPLCRAPGVEFGLRSVALPVSAAQTLRWSICGKQRKQPVAMGLSRIYGSTGVEAARGLMLRMDHGTQYLSDHFLNQIRFWGITPSFAFVEQPE